MGERLKLQMQIGTILSFQGNRITVLMEIQYIYPSIRISGCPDWFKGLVETGGVTW